MNRLLDRVAIITGAGQGVGRGIARRLASEGAGVVIAELNEETGQRTAQEIRSDFGVKTLFLATDVSSKESVLLMVETTVKTFGRVDILVNNAWAPGRPSRLESKPEKHLDRAVRIGLYGPFWAIQAVFPHMRRQGSGRIISICSLNGVNAHMYTVEYNAVKEALRALTRTAAREWAQYNILANIICPAAETPAQQAFARTSPENAAAVLKQNPMGRMGDPERDIGGVALFLASEDSCYVTGNTIFADGGGHINGVSWAPEVPESPI
ncbi:MAG: SDR family NAD(P)-dependent oxidoreductase [Chloroflexi bacterium]|nr:SDR family NAD(P)-dependent oxidoreductase [Chloroflexota bacterium]